MAPKVIRPTNYRYTLDNFKDIKSFNKTIRQEPQKRSGGYLSNLAYVNLFNIIDLALNRHMDMKIESIHKKKFLDLVWSKDSKLLSLVDFDYHRLYYTKVSKNKKSKNVKFKDLESKEYIDTVISDFYKESKKLLLTISKAEKDIVANKSKRLLDVLINEINKYVSYSPEIIGIYILSLRFTEAKNIHKDFRYFTNWNNYDRFFDEIEHNKDVDIEMAYSIAEKLKDRV
jgi:hypothetical protein